MSNALDAVPGAIIERPIFTCKVPPGEAQSAVPGFGLIASVGMTTLTASDEMMATVRSKNDPIRLAYEMAKQCVVQVNKRPVTNGDGSLDIFWERCHPALRTMIVSMYTKLNQPSKVDLDSFLQSCEVSV